MSPGERLGKGERTGLGDALKTGLQDRDLAANAVERMAKHRQVIGDFPMATEHRRR